ncbi:MAG: phosphatidate cytidylyltransferase [Mycoplasmoidaceae bacterium]
MIDAQQIEQRRQTLLTRSKSAIFIVAFYAAYLLLLFFANQHWFKPLASLEPGNMYAVQFTLGFINILMLAPVIYYVSWEITNLCFPGRKKVFIYTVCSTFALTLGMGVFLIGTRYQLFPIHISEMWNSFTIFLLVSLIAIICVTIISTFVWMYIGRHIVYVGKKTRVWYPVLVFILNTFFVGFLYTTIIHTWTTYMFLMLISVLSDVFAYLGGVLFGKHKMAPNISPKKSWEGLGIGFGITTGIVCGFVGLFHINGAEAIDHTLYKFLGCQTCPEGGNLQPYFWAIYISVILIIMCVSAGGDLFFSFIKRRFNIKDFGYLIPGHGGVLDRIDALTFTFSFYFLITVICQLICCFIPGHQTGLLLLWEWTA